MTSSQTPPDRAVADRADDWSDAFDQLIAKGTRNAIDLPTFYKFSEERYRYIENGTRIQDPDADSTRFTDTTDHYLLEPNAGDTIELRTAESPRYVVGSDAKLSWSFKFRTDLVDATDTLTLFLGGAFEVEYDGSGAGALRAIDNGTVQKEITFDPPAGLGSPTRPELTFNWYGVGRLELEIDYTEDNAQTSSEKFDLTVDDDWISGDPTGPMGFRLDVSNGGVQLETGSMAFIPQTDTPPTGRPKPHLVSSAELPEVGADGYTVLAAFRIDPERDSVYVTLSELSVAAEANADTEIYLIAVDPANTDADFIDVRDDGTNAGPAYPRNNEPQNSVLQWTPNVSTFPTRTYAVDGTQIPSGRSVAAAIETSSGQGGGTSKVQRSFTKKRPIYPDDVVLLIGHTPNESTATAVNPFMSTDQDW